MKQKKIKSKISDQKTVDSDTKKTTEPTLKVVDKSIPHRERGCDTPFTGVARSVECYDYEGNKNFRIVRLHIEKGVVVKREHSDPYALFELVSRCELEFEKASHALSRQWKEGGVISQ